MPINIIANFVNIPREDIGPFDISLLSYYSSGISLNPNKVNPINITNTGTTKMPCSGFIEVNNIGPTLSTIATGVTIEQLSTDYSILNLPCNAETLIVTAKGKCKTNDKINVFGLNGNPNVTLTIENPNDSNATISSTLTILPYDSTKTYNPIPTGVTITQVGIGYKSTIIKLYKGKYWFSFDITNSGGNIENHHKKATLTFNQCGDNYYVPPTGNLNSTQPNLQTNICIKWTNYTTHNLVGVSYRNCAGLLLCDQIIEPNGSIHALPGTISACAELLTYEGTGYVVDEGSFDNCTIIDGGFY